MTLATIRLRARTTKGFDRVIPAKAGIQLSFLKQKATARTGFRLSPE
jgi:hypothetical protein